MRRTWWKAYFFAFVTLLVVGLAALLFVTGGRDLGWEEALSALLRTLQAVGLFGLAFWRRIAVARLWQFVFAASVAYEARELYETYAFMTTDFENFAGLQAVVVWLLAAVTLVELPVLVALFLYGFRCRELWRGVT